MSDYANMRDLVASALASRLELVMVRADELDQLFVERDGLRAGVAQLAAKKPRAKKATPAAAGAGDPLPDWMPVEAWSAFLAMRVKIKKPATDYAQKLLIKKLAAFYANDLDPGVILNQSIVNSWQDLYAPKDASTAYRGAGRAPVVPVSDQNAANNAEALRLLGQPMFADDGMTIEAVR